jgi:hypothetical protein
MVFYGSQPGKETLDRGATSLGNPFATAFVQALSGELLSIEQFADQLIQLTKAESTGFQQVDVPSKLTSVEGWINRRKDGEKRVALVLVISDYSASGELRSLPGAKYDAIRVASALASAEYETTMVLDGSNERAREQLAAFSREAGSADVALIYTTGHGVEVDGSARLVMHDFKLSAGLAGLAERSISVAEIAKAATARAVNIVLFAACRNRPAGLEAQRQPD